MPGFSSTCWNSCCTQRRGGGVQLEALGLLGLVAVRLYVGVHEPEAGGSGPGEERGGGRGGGGGWMVVWMDVWGGHRYLQVVSPGLRQPQAGGGQQPLVRVVHAVGLGAV